MVNIAKPFRASNWASPMVSSMARAMGITDTSKDPRFTITVDTTKPGSASTNFLLPLDGFSTYNFDIDWGDGNKETITSNLSQLHVYAAPGVYTIKIGGINSIFPRMFFNSGGDRQKILAVTNWGNIEWQNFEGAFFGCLNLQILANDIPNISAVTNFFRAFRDCTSFIALSLKGWDFSNVTTMREFVRSCSSLTTIIAPDIDVSSVTTMRNFAGNCSMLSSFDISTWDTSSVTTFQGFAQNCPLLDIDLHNNSFEAVVNASDMLSNTSFSTTNYDLLLTALDMQTLNSGVSFHAGSACYSSGAPLNAKNSIVTNDLWTIADGGNCNDLAVWVGDTSNDYNTASNWLDDEVPDNTKVIVFHPDNDINCNMNVNVDVKGVDVRSGYTGVVTKNAGMTLDAGSAGISVADGTVNFNDADVTTDNGYVQTGGAVTLPSTTFDMANGGWNKTGGTVNFNSGQVDFTYLSGPQSVSNSAVEQFYKLRVAKNVWDFNVITTKIQVSNEYIIDNSGTSSSPEQTGTVELVGTAQLTQNGNMYGLGLISFKGTNHIWEHNNTNAQAQVPQITVDCTDLTLSASNVNNNFGVPIFTWLSGTITNANLYEFRNRRQFQHVEWNLYQPLTIRKYTWNSGNFDIKVADETGLNPQTLIVLEDYAIENISSGTQFTLGTIEVQGDYSQTGSGGASQSNGNLKFSGGNSQSINVAGGGTGRLLATSVEVDKSADVLSLLSDIEIPWAASDLTQTDGEIATNGNDINIGRDVTLNDDLSSLDGTTLTVGGDFDANNASLRGSAADWTLDVTGTCTADTCNIEHCDASPGTTLTATNSTDSGNNTNVTFV